VQLFADQEGNYPATNVQIIANPTSSEYNYCAYGSRIFDTIENLKAYASQHQLESYYSVLVKARKELNKAFHSQELDYEQQYPETSNAYNPYRYPESCQARRIYRSEAPAYLQLNHKYLPFAIEY
jgi:hypothetical protein